MINNKRLNVGCNWDPKLIELLPKDVRSVYGSIENLLAGNARFSGKRVTLEEANEFISKLHKHGIEFNYVINSPCLGNYEFHPEVNRKLIEHISSIRDIGTDSITVGNIYLIDAILKNFPDIKVTVSVTLNIDSLRAVKIFEEKGVDTIVLSKDLNRSFKTLKLIRANTNPKLDLQLIVNDPCLKNCPYKFYHNLLSSHHNQSGKNPDVPYVSYATMSCRYRFLQHPAEIIRAMWIRPEDLKYYQEIGYNSFKIVGRETSTPWLINAINAYSDEEYNGNLADLFSFYIQEKIPEKSFKLRRLNKEEITKIQDFKNYLRFKPYIDNSKLEGFLLGIRDRDCEHENCSSCRYCDSFAEQALYIDPTMKETVKHNLELAFELLHHGEGI